MRSVSFAALIVGVILIPTALGLAKVDHDREVSALERTLMAETNEHGGALDNYFARARAVILLTAQLAGVRERARRAGHAGARRCAARAANIAEVTQQLGYLEKLYPASIGEACFIDRNGEEFARVVRGEIAPADRPVDRGGAGAVLRADVRAAASGRPTRPSRTSPRTPRSG